MCRCRFYNTRDLAEITGVPAQGVNVHGLYLEGAGWEDGKGEDEAPELLEKVFIKIFIVFHRFSKVFHCFPSNNTCDITCDITSGLHHGEQDEGLTPDDARGAA